MIDDREAIKLDELVPSILVVGLANPFQQVMIRRVAAHTNGSEVSHVNNPHDRDARLQPFRRQHSLLVP